MTKAEAFALAKSKVPTEFDDPGYQWDEESSENHYDASKPLSYIILSIRGTASSPYQIALFHNGRFIGTATKEAYDFYPQVTRTASNSISVVYTYMRGNECAACATGRAKAGFTWSEAQSRVVITGNVPPQ